MVVDGAILPDTLLGAQGDVVRYTKKTDQEISKGQFVRLVDPVTISGANIKQVAAAGNTILCAGITSEDGESGATSMGVYTNVTADIMASGTIKAGAPIRVHSGTAVVGPSGVTSIHSGAQIIGYAQEDGVYGEKIKCRIRL